MPPPSLGPSPTSSLTTPVFGSSMDMGPGGNAERLQAATMDLKVTMKVHFSDVDEKIERLRGQLADCLDGIRDLQRRGSFDEIGIVKSETSQGGFGNTCAPRFRREKSMGSYNKLVSPQWSFEALRDVAQLTSETSKIQNPNRLMPSAAWDSDASSPREQPPVTPPWFCSVSEEPPPAIKDNVTTRDTMKSTATFQRSMTDMVELADSMHHRNSCAKWLWQVLEESDTHRWARYWARLWLCFVASSVLVTILQSLGAPGLEGSNALALEVLYEVIFVAELVLRYSVCPNTVYFVSNSNNIMDMVSILPLVVRAATGFAVVSATNDTDFVTWLLLCVVPVLRLVKMLRYISTEWELFKKVLESVWGAIDFLLFIGCLLLLIFSALIYLVEPRENIESFGWAMWLTLVTMTTVGYGDLYPATAEGRFIIVTLMCFSALYLSMPIGLVGSAFTQVWKDRDRIILVDKMQRRLKQWGYDAQDTPTLFKRYDSDNDGEINLADFRRMLKEFGIRLSEDRIVELFGSFDNDNSGAVDDQEFIHVLFPQTWHDMKEQERRREEEEQKRKEEAKERERMLRKVQREAKSMHTPPAAPPPRAPQRLGSQPSNTLSAWGHHMTQTISGNWRGRRSKLHPLSLSRGISEVSLGSHTYYQSEEKSSEHHDGQQPAVQNLSISLPPDGKPPSLPPDLAEAGMAADKSPDMSRNGSRQPSRG